MNSVPLVVFDMDGVLVHERSSWRLVHEAVGTSNEHSFRSYLRGEIDDEEFMVRDIRLWMEKGIRSRAQIEGILKEATYTEGLEECMEGLREIGARLAIISGGIDILAERLANSLGISMVHANGLMFINGGILSGEGILRVPLRDKGSVLRSILRENGRFHPVIVVGDSPVDMTMFELADLSIAFNPEDEDVSSNVDEVIVKMDLKEVLNRIRGYLGK